MPWNGTLLYLADIGAQGVPAEPRVIAGSAAGIHLPAGMVARRRAARVRVRPLGLVESLRLRPGGANDARAGADGGGVRRAAMDLRHVELCLCRPEGGSSAPIHRRGSGAWPCWISPSGALRPLDTPFTEFGSVRAAGARVVFRAGAPDHPAGIVSLDLGSGQHTVLKKATDILDRADLHLADYLTKVEIVEFPTTDGETAFGLFYPPRNPDYAGACRRTAAAAGQVPRRADLGGVEHAQSRHSILDQPRHRACSM